MPKPLRGFLLALWQHWKVLMSGTASIVLGLAALYFHGKPMVWVFLSVGVVCIFVACFQAWNDEHKALQTERAKLAALEAEAKTYPRLRLVSGSARSWMASLSWPEQGNYGSLTLNIFSVTFENQPIIPGEISTARGVTALVTFYELHSDEKIFETTGRWSIQEPPPGHDRFPGSPADVEPTTANHETVDFGVGQRRTLWIACKPMVDPSWPDRWSAFAFNPFRSELNWSPNRIEFPVDRVTAVIRLRCPHFDGSWKFSLRTPGKRMMIECRDQPIVC